MVMNLDQMIQEAEKSPEDMQQLADLDDAQPDTFELKPTSVQLNAESQTVVIYHSATGEPRRMPRLYARQALLKKFKARDGAELAGKFVFSTRPLGPYVLGTVKCLLHRDRPQRELYSSWGLPVCKSEHLPSEFEAEQHMKSRHAAAWSRIQEIRETQRRDEDRDIQRRTLETQSKLLESMIGERAPTPIEGAVPIGTAEAPLYVSDKPAKTATAKRHPGKSGHKKGTKE